MTKVKEPTVLRCMGCGDYFRSSDLFMRRFHARGGCRERRCEYTTFPGLVGALLQAACLNGSLGLYQATDLCGSKEKAYEVLEWLVKIGAMVEVAADHYSGWRPAIYCQTCHERRGYMRRCEVELR